MLEQFGPLVRVEGVRLRFEVRREVVVRFCAAVCREVVLLRRGTCKEKILG